MSEPKVPLRAVSDDPVISLAEAVVTKLDVLAAEIEGRRNDKSGEIVLPRWLAVIASAVFTAMIIGLFGFVLDISTRLAVEEAKQSPPPEVVQRMLDMERRLDRLEVR